MLTKVTKKFRADRPEMLKKVTKKFRADRPEILKNADKSHEKVPCGQARPGSRLDPVWIQPGPRAQAQGCAGWARNPNRPQDIPFCHQMDRRGTIWDPGTVPRGRISLRISPGGSHPLNLIFFTILEPKNAQIPNFGIFLKMDTPSQGGFGPNANLCKAFEIQTAPSRQI